MTKSLVFLKPDAVLRKGVGAAILQEFLTKADYSILAFKEVHVSEDLAKKHYEEHKDKHFFPWLIKAVRASPVLVMIMQGDIQKFRDYLGNTFVQKAEPKSVRGKYGIWGGVNSVHASDGVETGLRELALWKEAVNLQEDPEAMVNVQAFIEKWNEFKGKNTFKMRDLCKTLSENPQMKDQVYQQLIPLLEADCPQADKQTIENFATILVENVLI